MLRWRLNEIMGRHHIQGRELARYLGLSDNAISQLRKRIEMPQITTERWEQLTAAINALSKINEKINPLDLLEYVEESESGVKPTDAVRSAILEDVEPQPEQLRRFKGGKVA